MHKQLLNEATIKLTIEPDGPILIKASDTGADPTRPDMEFVRTTGPQGERTVYLPGSSLKGVLRAHCERIVRSLDKNRACDPLDDGDACSKKLENKQDDGMSAYKKSCLICQMFGNTALAGHLRTADAYPTDLSAVRTEQRNGVAIDRVFGSVKVGPFQFEAATSGTFSTEIQLRNFTLAQLGLVGLALRDLKLGRVGVGFGKSRGLGRVTATFTEMVIRYPACEVSDEQVGLLNGEYHWPQTQLVGVGRFPGLTGYGYPTGAGELAALPNGLTITEDEWLEPVLHVPGAQVEDVWRRCMPAWRETMRLTREAAR
jgi:CRISPR/Cas system CSM-associated protein Csm3 (group 7 of RAMP superfamily)